MICRDVLKHLQLVQRNEKLLFWCAQDKRGNVLSFTDGVLHLWLSLTGYTIELQIESQTTFQLSILHPSKVMTIQNVWKDCDGSLASVSCKPKKCGHPWSKLCGPDKQEERSGEENTTLSTKGEADSTIATMNSHSRGRKIVKSSKHGYSLYHWYKAGTAAWLSKLSATIF